MLTIAISLNIPLLFCIFVAIMSNALIERYSSAISLNDLTGLEEFKEEKKLSESIPGTSMGFKCPISFSSSRYGLIN